MFAYFVKKVFSFLQNKISNLKEICQQGKKIKGSLTTETEKEDCIFLRLHLNLEQRMEKNA